eukprot:scaffold12190_cov120-Isochrysis_galbana.AAC.2
MLVLVLVPSAVSCRRDAQCAGAARAWAPASGPCPHTRCVVSVGLACDLKIKISHGQCACSFRALCVSSTLVACCSHARWRRDPCPTRLPSDWWPMGAAALRPWGCRVCSSVICACVPSSDAWPSGGRAARFERRSVAGRCVFCMFP